MAAYIDTTTLPATHDSGRRVALPAEGAAAAVAHAGEAPAPGTGDQLELSDTGLRLGRGKMGGGATVLRSADEAAALVATLRRQMGVGPTLALKAQAGNVSVQSLALLRSTPA